MPQLNINNYINLITSFIIIVIVIIYILKSYIYPNSFFYNYIEQYYQKPFKTIVKGVTTTTTTRKEGEYSFTAEG